MIVRLLEALEEEFDGVSVTMDGHCIIKIDKDIKLDYEEPYLVMPEYTARGRISKFEIFSSNNSRLTVPVLGFVMSDAYIHDIEIVGQIDCHGCSSFTISNCSITALPQSSAAVHISPTMSTVKCEVSLSDTRIVTNSRERYGVLASGTCVNLKMNKCTISSPQGCAVRCKESKLEMDNCVITECESHAVWLENCPNFLIQRSSLSKIDESKSSAEIDAIFASRLAMAPGGVEKKLDSCIYVMNSTGVIRENVISRSYESGIKAYGSNLSIIENNLSRSQYNAIMISDNTSAKIIRNTITNIGYTGISLKNSRDCTIEECDVSNVGDCGVSVSAFAEVGVFEKRDAAAMIPKVQVLGCSFRNCAIADVEVFNRANVLVDKCNFLSISKCALRTFAMGRITATRNNFDELETSIIAKVKINGLLVLPDTDILDVGPRYTVHATGEIVCARNEAKKGSESKQDVLCKKCKKKVRNCIFGDQYCRHMVLCIDCARNALDNQEICPLCRRPLIIATPVFSEVECIICRNVFGPEFVNVLFPCGHATICDVCLEKWRKKKETDHEKFICPHCRKPVEKYIPQTREQIHHLWTVEEEAIIH